MAHYNNSGELFPGAYWLRSPSPDRDERDRRIQLRRSFILEEIPSRAEIRVTADAKYSLYVNGYFVNFGPARGFQRHWPFDRIDIAPYLRQGKNVIAALLYQFGMGNYTYIYDGDNGFLLSGKIGGEDISTGAGWKLRPAPGYICAVARGSGQYGFHEFFDFTASDDDNWFSPEYDDSSWKNDPRNSMRVAGCMPWHSFEERSIPLLTSDVLPAKQQVLHSCHLPAEDNWQKHRHIYYSYRNECFQWQKSDIPAGDTFVFDRDITALTVDFGAETVGKLIFDIDCPRDGEVLDFITRERLNEEKPDIPDSPCHPQTLFGGRLILRKGRNQHELTMPWGLRYVIFWKHQTGNLKIRLAIRQVRYPLDIHGKFITSDDRLQKIWDMSEHTQKCCSVDSFIDCPQRENAQWWGDALVQSQNTLCLSADPALLARGIRQIAERLTPDGLTYAMAPTAGHVCILPDYSAMWLITIWAHHFQTGSTELYEQLHDTIEAVCGYFTGEAAKNPQGLLTFDRRYWLFLDWCDELFKDGTPTLYNLIWLWSLKKLCSVAQAAGDTRMYTAISRQLTDGCAAVIKYLYDPASRMLYDGLTRDGRPVETHCPHTAAVAILLDILPEAHDLWLKEILLPLVNGDRGNTFQPSSYFMFYIFEALKIKGFHREVIDCIRRWWGEFADAGYSTTPENFPEKISADLSFCHAWSAHPLVHFSQILLGVTQTSANWQTVKFAPLLIPGVDISGAVPTPHGDIRVSIIWQNGRAEKKIELPPDIELDNRN